ncbi:TorF family putative porin [Pseudoalteromonas ruthenica]|uniref:TorF family putative porin n=1 Tax=Pseudoalteromonas ruthenica TaxID=151081 RepID=UPI00034A5BFF|nr:TorF family putative porin [Pseudoalteromonas ruthenica]
MRKTIYSLSAISLMMASQVALADWSATITGASDYTFNGVSQTENDPALQGSIDYAADNGFYAGSWASNVDFADGTDLEWDFYVGQFRQLNNQLSVDYGIAYYSYHGASSSSDGNYFEAYTKFAYDSQLGTTEANFWYTWDYFGTDAGHVISMLAHNYALAEGHNLRLSVDASNSLDGDKFAWQADGKSYVHYRLVYQTSYSGFDFELAAEDTNLDSEYADERLVLSVSKTFSL